MSGYAFAHDTKRKAIEMDVTLMNTEPGFNRCIRVGTAFDKLPEGFIILLSHCAITDVPFTTCIPHKYQVSLPYGKYLQPHQDRVGYGVAQFMKVSQCKFITRFTSHLRPEFKELSPVYIKTTAVIPQRNELLLPCNHGGRDIWCRLMMSVLNFTCCICHFRLVCC